MHTRVFSKCGAEINHCGCVYTNQHNSCIEWRACAHVCVCLNICRNPQNSQDVGGSGDIATYANLKRSKAMRTWWVRHAGSACVWFCRVFFPPFVHMCMWLCTGCMELDAPNCNPQNVYMWHVFRRQGGGDQASAYLQIFHLRYVAI